MSDAIVNKCNHCKSRGIIKSEAYMSNKTKQTGTLTLLVVLAIATTLALVGLAKKMQDAHVKSIQQTIEQQFKTGGNK